MSLDDKIGHIGYLIIAVGSLLIANQRVEGYLFRLVAAGIWIYLGRKLEMSSIWFWEILCVFTAVYGYANWSGWI